MSEMLNTMISKVKQPKPSFDEKESNPKKEYNTPKVGVLPTPKISTMPLLDEYIKKRNENPQIIYKNPVKKLKFFDFQNTLTVLIGIFGGISLMGAIKGIKNKIK